MLSCSFWFCWWNGSSQETTVFGSWVCRSIARSVALSQTFCLSCLLGAASEMRSGGFVTRTVCSMLEVKSVSPICFNFVKRSEQCYQWISVVGILDSSSSST
jgi:hypothetical protein